MGMGIVEFATQIALPADMDGKCCIIVSFGSSSRIRGEARSRAPESRNAEISWVAHWAGRGVLCAYWLWECTEVQYIVEMCVPMFQ